MKRSGLLSSASESLKRHRLTSDVPPERSRCRLILSLGNWKHRCQKIIVEVEIGEHGAQALDFFAPIDGVPVGQQEIDIRSSPTSRGKHSVRFYSILLGRYWIASAICAGWIRSLPARSAIVRTSFSTR